MNRKVDQEPQLPKWVLYICENASDGVSPGVYRPLNLMNLISDTNTRKVLITSRVNGLHSNRLPKIDRLVASDHAADIEIVRIGGRFSEAGSIGRLFNMLSFSIACILFVWKNRNSLKQQSSVITSSTGGIDALCGLFMQRFLHSHWVLEIRDIWPDAPLELKPKLRFAGVFQLIGRFQEYSVLKANAVISPLKNLRERFSALQNNSTRFRWIPNCAPEIDREKGAMEGCKEVKAVHQRVEEFRRSHERIFGYIGTMNNSNNIPKLIDLANKTANTKIGWVFIGSGPEYKHVAQAAETNPNIYSSPGVSPQHVAELYDFIDIAVLGLNWLKVYQYGLASIKYTEYLRAGKPVFCWGPHPESQKPGDSTQYLFHSDSPELQAAINDSLELCRLSDEELMSAGAKAKIRWREHFEYSRYTNDFLHSISSKTESSQHESPSS